MTAPLHVSQHGDTPGVPKNLGFKQSLGSAGLGEAVVGEGERKQKFS